MPGQVSGRRHRSRSRISVNGRQLMFRPRPPDQPAHLFKSMFDLHPRLRTPYCISSWPTHRLAWWFVMVLMLISPRVDPPVAPTASDSCYTRFLSSLLSSFSFPHRHEIMAQSLRSCHPLVQHLESGAGLGAKTTLSTPFSDDCDSTLDLAGKYHRSPTRSTASIFGFGPSSPRCDPPSPSSRRLPTILTPVIKYPGR